MSDSSIELNVVDGQFSCSRLDNEKTKINEKDENDTLQSCCTIQTDLIKFKAFFCQFGASIGSVFPYLSLYYKQLGFSPNQIGIISGMRPLVGFCSGPIWGSIADRFRIRKIILSVSAVGWLCFVTAIGFVPPPDYSQEQCGFVNEYINSSQGVNVGERHTGISRAQFLKEHAIMDDMSPDESLLESRGWMFTESSINRAFFITMLLMLLGEVLQSPLGAIADCGCIETLGTNDMNKYGHQRAFGSIGFGLTTLLAGSLVSLSRKDVTICGVTFPHSNYHFCFYVFIFCMTSCLITTLFFTFKKEDDEGRCQSKPNPLKVFRMFLTVHYASWLLCMLFTGICNGVLWGFLNWHLENLGATQFVIGCANLTSLLSETVMFFVIFRVLCKTSCITFMLLGLLGYVVRFLAFSIIQNPWMVLPFEILQGFTFAGTWSVYVKYLCSDVPSEYLGTLQGFLHGFYWGLGSGTGHMLGGLAVEMYGARWTFRVFAAASLFNLGLFFIIQKLTTQPKVFDYEDLEDKK